MKDLLVLLADGFEEVEALSVVDIARRAGLLCETCSIKESKKVRGAHGILVISDTNLDSINIEDYRALYIPGGSEGANNLKNDPKVIEIIEVFNEDEKILAAICAGPTVLDRAKVLSDGEFTCYPGVENRMTVKDPKDLPVYVKDNVITGMGPGLSPYMGLKISEYLAGKEKTDKVKEEFLLNKLENFIKEDKVD